MSIILMTEAAASTKSDYAKVSDAIANLVEVAYGSETPFTIDQLMEMVEENMRDAVFCEGFLRSQIGQTVDDLNAMGDEIAGWFSSVDEKRRRIERECDHLIAWLKEEDRDHPGLSLEMGPFFTWLKTSEWARWRYFFFLDNSSYSGLVGDIKAGKKSEIEGLANFSLDRRKAVTRTIDGAKTVKDLIKIAETFKERALKVIDLMKQHKTYTSGAPIQVTLLAMVDLRATLKKIVRLAK